MSSVANHRKRSHRAYKTELSNLQWFYRGASLRQQVKIQAAEGRKSFMARFLEMLKDEKADEAALSNEAVANE